MLSSFMHTFLASFQEMWIYRNEIIQNIYLYLAEELLFQEAFDKEYYQIYLKIRFFSFVHFFVLKFGRVKYSGWILVLSGQRRWMQCFNN